MTAWPTGLARGSRLAACMGCLEEPDRWSSSIHRGLDFVTPRPRHLTLQVRLVVREIPAACDWHRDWKPCRTRTCTYASSSLHVAATIPATSLVSFPGLLQHSCLRMRPLGLLEGFPGSLCDPFRWSSHARLPYFANKYLVKHVTLVHTKEMAWHAAGAFVMAAPWASNAAGPSPVAGVVVVGALGSGVMERFEKSYSCLLEAPNFVCKRQMEVYKVDPGGIYYVSH